MTMNMTGVDMPETVIKMVISEMTYHHYDIDVVLDNRIIAEFIDVDLATAEAINFMITALGYEVEEECRETNCTN